MSSTFGIDYDFKETLLSSKGFATLFVTFAVIYLIVWSPPLLDLAIKREPDPELTKIL